MKCPNCGTENASGVNFCVSCGCQLPIETVNTCQNCGMQNSPEVAFCVNCGMPLASGQQNNPPVKKSSFNLNAIKEKVLPIVKNKFVLLGAGALVLVIILISVISSIIGSNNGYIELDRAPMYYESDGKIYISSEDKLLKSTIPGKTADSGVSIDGKVLYIINDEKDLYIINGNKVQKVASDVHSVELSVTGKGLLYTTVNEDNDEVESELFHYILGKKPVSVADGNITGYAISPDGKTATYMLADDDNEKAPLYFFDGKKSTKVASSDLQLCGMSNDGKYIYATQTNDEDEVTLYSYNKKGDRTKIGRIGSYSPCFNADHTQALFYYDGKTYISEKGKEVDGCAKNKILELLTIENCFGFGFGYTYPVDSFYDHVYYSGNDVWFIRKNSDKSVKLASKAYDLQLDSTASYLYYTYDEKELRVIKISDGEKATEKAKTIVDEKVSTYVVTSDRDFVYYVYDKELYSANGKKGKNVKKISNDEIDYDYESPYNGYKYYKLYISSNDTVFYSVDSDLYASSNGKKGTKVLSEGQLEHSLNGYVFATGEDETIWWVTNSKKFKKIITIEEE